MISYKQGDLLASDLEAIVNTVNCVGVMGRGIALQFKKKHFDNFKKYEDACKRGEVMPGKMFIFKTSGKMNPKFIINFPTKRHWRGTSKIEDIETGLQDLLNVIKNHQIKSIAIPPLGCGLGGLKWSYVKPRIESALGQLEDVNIVIFEPKSTPSLEIIVRNMNTL